MLLPEFVNCNPSWILINVQVSVGKPLKVTLPFGVVQVGWTIKSTIGALWIRTVSISIFSDDKELHVPLETEKE